LGEVGVGERFECGDDFEPEKGELLSLELEPRGVFRSATLPGTSVKLSMMLRVDAEMRRWTLRRRLRHEPKSLWRGVGLTAGGGLPVSSYYTPIDIWNFERRKVQHMTMQSFFTFEVYSCCRSIDRIQAEVVRDG
jgi:hypothetical protein